MNEDNRRDYGKQGCAAPGVMFLLGVLGMIAIVISMAIGTSW